MYIKYVIGHGDRMKIGMAMSVRDSKWIVKLSAEETKGLIPSSAELAVIIVSKLVGIQTMAKQSFTIAEATPMPTPTPILLPIPSAVTA